MNKDYATGLIWLLFDMTDAIFPPFLLEIVLKDGRSFYIHSPNNRDKKTNSIILNVYDFRALDNNNISEIRSNLDNMNWGETYNLKQLHELLDYGRLRINFDNILYVVEWHRRTWNKYFSDEFLESYTKIEDVGSD